MSKRYAAVLTSLAMLLLAACNNASDSAKQTAQVPPPGPITPPPAAAIAPPPSQPGPAPAAGDMMTKPPGTDPAKLAEHAKALKELGYQEEAAKLYSHACQWGYAPACAQAKVDSRQAMPAPAAGTAAQAKPVTTAQAKPAPVAAKTPASPLVAAKAPASPAMPPAAPPPAHVAAPPAPMPPAVVPTSPPPAAPVVLAAAKPTTPLPVPEKPASVDTHKLSQQAQGLEQIGYVPEAVTLYRDACLAGDGQACKRLGEIYIKGSDGVQRDYAESVRWYERARKLGIAVPTLEKRTVYR